MKNTIRPSQIFGALLATVCLAGQSNAQGVTIPSGTAIVIRTIDAIDSKDADLNHDYAASLADPVLVDGVEIVPRGAGAVLRVAQAQHAKAFWGRASLTLKLAAITVNGQRVRLESGGVSSQSGSQAAKAGKGAGVGAAAGAGIGAIAAGGFGAAVGAGIGSVVGATTAAVSGQRVKVDAESRLTFTLAQPATLASGMPLASAMPVAAAAPVAAPTANVASTEPVPAPIAPPPPPPESGNSVPLKFELIEDGIRVQLEKCYRKAAEATVCEVTVEALSKDAPMSLNAQTLNTNKSFIVDSKGLQRNASSATLGSSANRPAAQTFVVQNVPVRGELQFRGSETGIKTIALVSLALGQEKKEYKFVFHNVPLEDAGMDH